ncbi:MAG: hypothetical protein KGI54_12370 [Pseudomonadota bacterium]|nr:hypothetical protein [Pseudomonadota bacterium]
MRYLSENIHTIHQCMLVAALQITGSRKIDQDARLLLSNVLTAYFKLGTRLVDANMAAFPGEKVIQVLKITPSLYHLFYPENHGTEQYRAKVSNRLLGPLFKSGGKPGHMLGVNNHPGDRHVIN